MLFHAVSGTLPFTGSTVYAIRDKIKGRRYYFECSKWNTKPECKELVTKLMQPSHKRLTPRHALMHEWFSTYSSIKIHKGELIGPIIINALVNHRRSRKNLRKVMLKYLADQLVDKDFGPMKAAFAALDYNCDGKIGVKEAINCLNGYVTSETLMPLIEEIESEGSITYKGIIYSLYEQHHIEYLIAALGHQISGHEGLLTKSFIHLDKVTINQRTKAIETKRICGI
eukprot:TRINITY_DN278_c1_g1_i1.p2 TRINITY_DN278_c1_g1~~TRINITY_DN278_c1_g1_i1.p2  ORF type:complete len:227 (+),score=10.50 TRINITY_DN278_c1_g1_i1:844-1524(+)